MKYRRFKRYRRSFRKRYPRRGFKSRYSRYHKKRFTRRRFYGRKTRYYLKKRSGKFLSFSFMGSIKPSNVRQGDMSEATADKASRKAWYGDKFEDTTNHISDDTQEVSGLARLVKAHNPDISYASGDWGAIKPTQAMISEAWTRIGNQNFGWHYFKAIKVSIMGETLLDNQPFFSMYDKAPDRGRPPKYRSQLGKMRIYLRTLKIEGQGMGVPAWELPNCVIGGRVGSRYKIKVWYKPKRQTYS